MKIALIGYGKMGKAIEKIAIQKGHEIVAKIDVGSIWDLNDADVAIEFTRPDVVVENLIKLAEFRIPVIVGTTGWYEHFDEVKNHFIHHDTALLTATNFSIGVHLFWNLTQKMATLMNTHPEYKASLHEIHHTQKLDAPSGTAITTAEVIIENSFLEEWVHGETNQHTQLSITHERTDLVPGTHTITYKSEVDEIRLTHEAFSRDGFAHGAVNAAEWIIGKQGIFGMNDMLGIS
jgi:4-hydroxy-tetrahydrodipicolinate reductase